MSEKQETQSSKTARPRRRPHRLWSVLIGAAILICGMIIGACLTLVVVRNRVIDLIHHPQKRTAAMVRRLDRALDLSQEQRGEVREVLRKHRAEFNEIRREVGPRVKRQIEALDRDVSAVLDPEQKRKWDRLLNRLRRLWMPRFRRGERTRHESQGAPGKAVP